MPKLNSRLDSYTRNRSKGTSSIRIGELVYNITQSFGFPAKMDYSDIKCDVNAEQFFSRFYIKQDTFGKLDKKILDVELSSAESKILNYILGSNTSNPMLILGHSGSGKSTLVKYLVHYLWPTNKILQDHFIPIHISLAKEKIRHSKLETEGDYFKYIDSEIVMFTNSFILEYFINEYQNILNWIQMGNPIYRQFARQFPQKTIEEIKQQTPDAYLKSLDPIVAERLMIESLAYYSKHKKHVVIFIDDVDRCSIDVHRFCFNYIYKRIGDGFITLAAMRISTFAKLKNIEFENTDNIKIEKIEFNIETVKNLIAKRIEKAKTIALETRAGIPIQASEKDVIESFIKLLSHSDINNILANISNQNIDSLFSKLSLMLDSWYFDDELLVKELLSQKVSERTKKSNLPVWLVYSLLFANYNGTFKTSDDVIKYGIINLFSSTHSGCPPFKYFIRLHLLAFCYAFRRDHSYASTNKIYTAYCALFGKDAEFTSIFNKSIYRLLQSHLLFNKSCIPYNTELEFETKRSKEEICISDAGVFYLSTIIHRTEYLLFMKDDIDWPYYEIEEIGYNLTQPFDTFEEKIRNTLKALNKLIFKEGEMLTNIYNLAQNNSNYYNIQLTRKEAIRERNPIVIYNKYFSPKNIENGFRNAFFTICIYNHYKRFLNHRVANYLRIYKNEIEDIEETIVKYDEINKAF